MTFQIDPRVFDPANISPETKAFNATLSQTTASQPGWWQIGAAEYRRLRAEGKTALPPPVLLPTAIPFEIESREPGRKIPCRVFKPESNDQQLKTIFLHFHGGGWVLGSETGQDTRMQRMANDYSVICITVGYRLAPEHPFPAGPEDCFDVAEWLIEHSQHQFGASLGFIGGESAGGHLSALTALHLLQHADSMYSTHALKGLILHYGCYSMRWLPSVYSLAKREPNLVLSLEIMTQFKNAFLGKDWSPAELDDSKVSPLYADLSELRGKLPPALFTCGSEDYLLDDTLFMASRWLASGGNTSVEIVNGAPHGFMSFERSVKGSGAAVGQEAELQFISGQY